MTEQDTNTDTVEPQEPAQEPTETDQEAQEQPEPNEDTSQVRKARKEAAGYRTRARDAETKAEALQQRVEALEWAEVERHLPKNSPRLEGLKKLGLELEEVKDDEGNVSREKVQTAVTAAAELVGISMNAQPHMPLEGRAPNPLALSKDVESSLKRALGI